MILTSADGDGKILSYNVAFKKLLGLRDDVTITSLVEVVDQEDWKKAASTHALCLTNNQTSYNLKLKLIKSTNETITVISHNDILSDTETLKPLFCLNIMTEKV
jgi:PAS domain-containing protein